MGNINFVIITGKLGECVRQEKVISGGGGGGGVRGGVKGFKDGGKYQDTTLSYSLSLRS